MVPISVEKFADMVMESSKGYNRKELIETLQAALDAKNHGAKCILRPAHLGCGLRHHRHIYVLYLHHWRGR